MANDVVFVSAVQPSPPDSGKKVVVAGFLSYWAERVGRDHVHLVLVGHDGPVPADLPAVVHRLPRPARVEQLVGLGAAVLSGRRSIQEALLRGRALQRSLTDLLARLDADLEVYDTIRFGQYLPDLPRRRDERRVVYLDDLFSLRYGAMLRTLQDHPDVDLDVLGDFADKVPSPLRALLARRAVQTAALALERRLVARREEDMVSAADACLLVNETEADILRARTAGVVAAVPPAVPEGARRPRAYDGRPEYVLLGLLSLPHNHDGTLTFLQEVLPALLARRPDARVRILGRDAAPEVQQAAARYGDSVSVEGYVADLDGVLATACALVTPLRFGSGLKIKVLQALARGLPVVSTPVGADGIVQRSGSGITVADLAGFSEALVALTDLDLNAAAGEQARAAYERRYSPAAAAAVYDAWLRPGQP